MLAEEQKLIQQTAFEFARDHLKPLSAQWSEKAEFPKEAIKQLSDLGFMGILVDEAYGGVGANLETYALIIEEIARGDASVSTILAVHNSVGCMPIQLFGNASQREKFLPNMAQGQWLGAFCLTEPHAGSDAASLSTKAQRKGDHYLLNGTKCFITSGQSGDIAIVFARTSEDGPRGISAFIVPTDTQGYEVVRIEKKMGQMASDTAMISFTDCAIPSEYRLGDEGQGYKIALSQLESGRVGIAAQAVGIAQAALDAAIDYANERESFGKLIKDHQAIAFNLAQMSTEVEAARQLTLAAARLKDAKQPSLQMAAQAKLFASEVCEKVTSMAIQIHGGYGYLQDYPVEQLYRDGRVTTIYEGTSEIQKLIVARELMKNR